MKQPIEDFCSSDPVTITYEELGVIKTYVISPFDIWYGSFDSHPQRWLLTAMNKATKCWQEFDVAKIKSWKEKR